MTASCVICGKSPGDFMVEMKFRVNPECGHEFCVDCINKETANTRSDSDPRCPGVAGGECGVRIKWSGLQERSKEDLDIDRELEIRQRVRDIYTREEGDFELLAAYNDYLEEIEDIVFNLTNGEDVPATEARIASYKAAHAEEIPAHLARRTAKQTEVEAQLERERQAHDTRKREAEAEKAQVSQEVKRIKTQRVEVALGERVAVDPPVPVVRALVHPLGTGPTMMLGTGPAVPKPLGGRVFSYDDEHLRAQAKRRFTVEVLERRRLAAGFDPNVADVRAWEEARGSLGLVR